MLAWPGLARCDQTNPLPLDLARESASDMSRMWPGLAWPGLGWAGRAALLGHTCAHRIRGVAKCAFGRDPSWAGLARPRQS